MYIYAILIIWNHQNSIGNFSGPYITHALQATKTVALRPSTNAIAPQPPAMHPGRLTVPKASTLIVTLQSQYRTLERP